MHDTSRPSGPIAAYKADRAETEAGRGAYGQPGFQEHLEACERGHFGLPDPATGARIDNLARLWRWIVHVIESVELRNETVFRVGCLAMGDPPGVRPYWDNLLVAYGHMHRLRLRNAPVPPYRELTENESRDMLQHIANEIEAAEHDVNQSPTEPSWEQRRDDLIGRLPKSEGLAVAKAIEVLAKESKYLTTSKLLPKLEGGPDESTCKKALAKAVAQRVLVNLPRGNPRGYGLPMWNDPKPGA